MASAIIGGKRRIEKAALQKAGKNQEKAAIEGAKKPQPVKKSKKKAY